MNRMNRWAVAAATTLVVTLVWAPTYGATQNQPPDQPAEQPLSHLELRVSMAPTSNVRVDVLVTETAGSESAGALHEGALHEVDTRAVHLTLANGEMGSVRSAAHENAEPWSIDIDATPLQLDDGKVLLKLMLELSLPDRRFVDGSGTAHIFVRDSLTVVLKDGEPLVVAESTDPLSGRIIAVEATATVLQ